MSEKFELIAQKRADVGKGASRRLRRKAGLIPAIVYGAGKEPVMITLEHHKITRALQDEAFYTHILFLDIEGEKEQVVLKALQRHPFKPQILHMDLLRISADEKIYMHIPLHFTHADIAPGVKTEGGQVSHHISEVEVRCFPKDLPEFIEVDLANMRLNEIIHLSDLKLPSGVELVALLHGDENDQPVVSIHSVKVAAEPEEATPEAPVTEITSQKADKEEAEGE